ncbi:Mercuric reductase [Piscirickettsia salmonis]|uniref:dihydrolipoyl dehydrogenase n=2 Tax=Piscirickettsia salmonis TaxID=1238 RepID=UPI0012BB071B|nr:dihydrolipoyl dehydrogenase [Piscirickettsia salmonis]QGP54650.1 Mercuric reductase [Piscirickettsia salmonis]QGP59453.1 Mercuric reductase [Piscirickettsia salmonis]QGP64150.1 Mercuric reductase [Piscirickettsia salmonis]
MDNKWVVDIAIIGTGTAGMAAYREAIKFTKNIVLLEASTYGTTCARVGCMPSKLLIAPAHVCHKVKSMPTLGLQVGPVSIDGQAVMRRVRDERDRFVHFVKEAVVGFDTNHLVQQRAKFNSDHELILADGRIIQAERIIIATGSRPYIPDELQAAGSRLMTNDEVFDWQDLPQSIAVFGAGVIGLELGQALHRLGVNVELFGRTNAISLITDPDINRYAVQTFQREFTFHAHADISAITEKKDHVEVRFNNAENENVEQVRCFEYILAATGRIANVDGLGLETTTLALNHRGVPLYDPLSMRCGDSNIFIAGDACGDLPLLHEAADEGKLAGQNAGRFPEVFKQQRYVPLGIAFTDPQLAVIGQSYRQLSEGSLAFKIGRVLFEDQGRSRVMLVNKGVLHVYGECGTGRLLGAEVFGPNAEHLAHLLAWSIQSHFTVIDILHMPFYHPVIEEGLRSALRDLLHNLQMGPLPPARCIDCGVGA